MDLRLSVVVSFLEGLEVECLGGKGKMDFVFSQRVAPALEGEEGEEEGEDETIDLGCPLAKPL